MSANRTGFRRCWLPQWLVCICGLLPVVVAAADVEVTADVDRRRVAINEPVQLTLTITSARQLVHVPAPQIDLRAFEVFGPAVSTRMEIVNRRTSFSRDLVYTLYARRPGRFTIGAGSFVIENETYTTQPILIEATKAGRSTAANRQSADAGGGDELTDNLFLRATLDRDTVYVNEQVTASFDLCYRYNLRDVGFTQIPTFSGFWTQELFVAQRLDPQIEVIEGRQYHVASLRRMALFPTRGGSHEIEAMVVTCAIPQRRQRRSALDAFSIFDDPLFGRTQNVMVRSVPLLVHARPLPQEGRPADFTGLVGRIQVEAAAEPRQVSVGDPVTLRLKVTGIGNMQSLAAPELEIDGLKIYEPKGEVAQTRSPDGRLGGEALYEYIVIPERVGTFEIPAIGVSYFDPAAHAYHTAATASIQIDSDGGEQIAAIAPVNDMTRSEIEELGSDVRHIKPDIQELHAPTVLYRQPLFWVLQLLLPLGYVALVFVRRHQERLRGDVAYARRRGADSAARRRLQGAADLTEGSEAEFYAALHGALVGFVADHTNESAPGMDRERCGVLLTQQGVPAAIIHRLDTILHSCEQGRFAPGRTPVARRQGILQESEGLIEELREAIS